MCLPAIALTVLAAAGTHTRWESGRGPIHTWRPGAAVPSTVVLYVHGYRDDADSAFVNHRLADQFAASGFDALFVVPEAPSGPQQKVFWPDLEALLTEVAAQHRAPLPTSVLVIGHSGGNRTLKAWLASERVNHVVLLDGFYGDPTPFEQWLAARGGAQLIMVGQVTYAKADAWKNGLPAVARKKVAHHAAGCSHMEIVTAGKWIPAVLRPSA
jgi:hypothetical protein